MITDIPALLADFLFFRFLRVKCFPAFFTTYIFFPALCISCTFSHPFCRWHVFPRLTLLPVTSFHLFLHKNTVSGEIRDTKTLNIVSLQVLVDVSSFSPCVINLSRNKNICCGSKKVVAKSTARVYFEQQILALMWSIYEIIHICTAVVDESEEWAMKPHIGSKVN